MAIHWGSAVSGGGWAMRVGIDYTTTRPTHTSTSITITFTVWTQNSVSRVGKAVPMQVNLSGSTGNKTITFTNDEGTEPVQRGGSYSVTYNYPANSWGTSPSKWSVTAKVVKPSSSGAAIPQPSVTRVVYVTPRPLLAPVAPTDLRVVRLSDTQVRLTFSRWSTNEAPWHSVEVQRQWHDDGIWRTVGKPNAAPGGFNTWTDTTNEANRRAIYRVRAINTAGASAWSPNSNAILTTPAAPKNLTARWISSLNPLMAGRDWVELRWSRAVRYPHYTHDVQRRSSTDGKKWGAWEYFRANGSSTVNTKDMPATTSTLVDKDPPTGLVEYRVNAGSLDQVATAAGPLTSTVTMKSQASPWTTVQLSVPVPPLAPTLLTPANGSVVDSTRPITFSWRHQSAVTDNSTQTAAVVHWSADNGATWTNLAGRGVVEGPLQSIEVPAGTWTSGTSIRWRARTRGAVPEFSEWTYGSFTVYAPPVVTITAPPATVTTRPFTVAWTMTGGAQQSQWLVSIVQNSVAADGAVSAVVVASGTGSDYATREWVCNEPLVNHTTYTVTVQVWGQGIPSAPVSTTFTTNYPDPVPVTLEAHLDPETGTVPLHVSVMPSGVPAPGANYALVQSYDVQRRIDGGQWVTIQTNVVVDNPSAPSEQWLLDVLPTLNGVNDYRLLLSTDQSGFGATPATTVEVHGFEDVPYAFLNWGSRFETVERAACDPQVSETMGRSRAAHPILGRRDPVLLVGDQRSHVVDVGMAVNWFRDACLPIEGDDDDQRTDWAGRRGTTPRDGWLDAGRNATIVCYRDWHGRRVFGMLSDVKADDVAGTVNSAIISFSVTRTHWAEGEPLRIDPDLAWTLPEGWSGAADVPMPDDSGVVVP